MSWDLRDFVELFALSNLAFLGVDIFIAHSMNNFRHWAEWVPLAFSAAGSLVMLIAIIMGGLAPRQGVARWLGLLIGWVSVFVGIAGLLLHLNSQFFELQTLRSLVYTAPFAAPLAYTGLGLLLILDRMIPRNSLEWAGWVLVLAAGGFLGNFVLSLADHAVNGFFRWTEWIPVGAGAFALTFLILPLWTRTSPAFLKICMAVMGIQIVVGVLGFAFHVIADLHGPSSIRSDNFLYGAPPFAPLLFANIAVLALLGLWGMLSTSRDVAT